VVRLHKITTNITYAITYEINLYAPYLQKGIREFCTKNEINYEIYNGLNPEVIKRDEVF